MKTKILFLVLTIFGLITIESNAQRLTFNRDGFYRITSHYSPTSWQLFDFYINPFSPYFVTEVAVPDSAFILIDILNEQRTIVNSAISNPIVFYEPAIYEINWNNISDDFKLPVINGNYLVRLKAYNDSSKQNLVFSDSAYVPVLEDWEDLEPDTVLNFIETFPGYFIPITDSLRFNKEREKKGIHWQLLGARFKKIGFEDEDYLLSLSFKFTLNEYERAFSSFYKASKVNSTEIPFHIDKKLSFNRIQIVEIKLRYKGTNLFVIQQFDSDLAVLDLEKLWNKILNK